MANFFERLFSEEARLLKKYEAKAQEVDALKDKMAALNDGELQDKTVEFRARLKKGETLDDLLPEAFAVIREAAKRVIGEFPYMVQIIGSIVMHNGDIAEMKTGEGKTLTSIMCTYLNALSGEGVHVVTVNEYLASRDARWMGQIFEFLGLSVGVNARELTPDQKRAAYACDITYTTNAELGFDYLRDNMVTRVQDRVLRGLHFAMVDEVDSILVDESRTPLIISGGKRQTANLYKQADIFAKALGPDDYTIDAQSKAIQLTDSGVDRAEKMFSIKNLYDIQHTQLVHHIQQALKANYIMGKDVEYVVQDNEIVIVDQFTGRIMKGRAYSDGLHQAIEAKEGVTIKEETSTLATITYQNFFRLYDKLAGMTGTAKTEEEEFLDTYNMRVISIPTNRPVQRIDYPDAIFANQKLKFNALVKEVIACHEKGQPVLVGTISVEVSEQLSEMLREIGIKHEVLNAKNHAREAEIIALAGHKGAVTIATNMAGRGTDIKINDEVRALGGLAVLGSERHESRRIDNQLRGRSGRQGDPGYSRFYVSLRDELMVRFGGEKLEGLFDKLGDEQIESPMVTKAITSAQKRVEGQNFDIRKSLLEYDDVLRQQREIMYEQRNYVLENEDVHAIVRDMFDRVITATIRNNADPKHDKVNGEEAVKGLDVLGCPEGLISASELDGKSIDEAATLAADKAWKAYNDKIEPVMEGYLPFEKNIVLKTMDRNWIDHIDTMDKLRNGIHLRSYAQTQPLQAYVEEGYAMFEEMMEQIAREVVFYANKMNIQVRERAPR
ncbi:preprotein translocase subunit SecA [Dielma fastidiosa]|uniref:preprotein translocase subunit SecA n=1 Tax=Dielma fastidiosa TaxID=1034346 RepID=UPI000E52BEA1|nr:preprotein translocase subunit SecA [Dielma fastidiosa]RHN00269.1 preprotein translocase subunit SecA [Dielma fastidiosa]